MDASGVMAITAHPSPSAASPCPLPVASRSTSSFARPAPARNPPPCPTKSRLQAALLPASPLTKVHYSTRTKLSPSGPLYNTNATCSSGLDRASVRSNSRILVLGGSGAVGQMAIQLAKSRGAWVATTCSTRSAPFVAQFNPDRVIDYSTVRCLRLTVTFRYSCRIKFYCV